MRAPVSVVGLSKSYGAILALDKLSFDVTAGELCCLVGPNGAGKTTLLECLEGLTTADSGDALLLGQSVALDRVAAFRRIGVQLQEGGLYRRARVHELCRLFASMYEDPEDIGALLADFGLDGTERQPFGSLSGGQKRRVLIALALVGKPELVLLDEPTTGLDPQARYQVWKRLSAYVEAGKTVFASTHQLLEAEEYGTSVVMLNKGRLVAQGPPRELLERAQIAVRISLPINAPNQDLRSVPGVTGSERIDDRLVVYGKDSDVVAAISAACGGDIIGKGAEVRSANLDDLFLLITGRDYRASARPRPMRINLSEEKE